MKVDALVCAGCGAPLAIPAQLPALVACAFCGVGNSVTGEATVAPVELDSVHQGTVQRILAFGAIVRLSSGKEALLHISELTRRVAEVSDLLHVGQVVRVKVISISDRDGRARLSMKALLPADGH